MLPTFRTLAVSAAAICFTLASIWLLAPNVLLDLWAVQYSYPVGLVGRRAAALFLGIGVMFYLARDAQPSQGRNALSIGLSTGCIALAALGIFEFATDHAGPGIWSAVVIELALAAAFISSTRGEGVRARKPA
jgi:threonine/homoserine efflux transporter RhtA